MSAQLVVEYAKQIGSKDINWSYNLNTLCVNNVQFDIIDSNVVAHDNVESQHLVRLIKLNIDNNDNFSCDFSCDLIMFLNEIVPNFYNMCTICGSHLLVSNVVDTCGKLDCINRSLKLVTNNYVCDYFNRDENVFMLHIYIAYSCLKHPNATLVMIPFPTLTTNIVQLASTLQYDITNINKLIEIMRVTHDDNTLIKLIGKTEYGFLKFVLKTNNTNLISSKLFDKYNDNQTTAFSSNDVICYDVRHEPILEKKFANTKLRYYFHGSSLANWYAILRNGLKNCSGTKLMANGQAYGSGIYLSDSATMSFGYGNDKYTRIGTSVVGVVQVIGDTLKDNKNQIFVETTETNLLLRYVLLIKNSQKCNTISEYFTKKIPELHNSTPQLVPKIVSKRLTHDLKEMTKIANKYMWNIDSSINAGYTWVISIDNVCELYVEFGQSYPIDQPFLWLQSTTYMSSSVTKYGAVFLNEIVPKNWIISTKIYNIIEKFICDLSSGTKVHLTTFDHDVAFHDYSLQLKVLQLV